MADQEQPKIEVKVSASITVPLWTAGWLYTLGALLAGPENVTFLEGLSKFQIIMIMIGTYVAWPFLLGYGTWLNR